VIAPRLHGLHNLQRLHRLHELTHITDQFARFGDDFTGRWQRRVHRRQRGPSFARLLLAGLAVFAFAKAMSMALGRRRSTAEKLALGVVILLLGAVLMAFRRPAPRRGW
jgi:hypothetical protein